MWKALEENKTGEKERDVPKERVPEKKHTQDEHKSNRIAQSDGKTALPGVRNVSGKTSNVFQLQSIKVVDTNQDKT